MNMPSVFYVPYQFMIIVSSGISCCQDVGERPDLIPIALCEANSILLNQEAMYFDPAFNWLCAFFALGYFPRSEGKAFV